LPILYKNCVYRLAYPTRPPSWKIAKRRVVDAINALTAATKNRSIYSTESFEDFAHAAAGDAEYVCYLGAKVAKDFGDLDFWFANSSWRQLEHESLGWQFRLNPY